ncbi:MAG TPA: porin PorA family protein, partial [Marmoricola sp.]|nr:porin PorA family protein [Marmoricola sp.]
MGKKLGAVLVGLGVLLLTMGLLSKFYAYSRLAVAPANQNSVTLAIAKDATYFSIADRAEKTGDLLTTVNTVGDVNASKQISEKLGKAVVVWEQMSYSDSPDFNKSSGQAPLSATHSRIAFDANTGEAVQCCGTFVTEGADLDSGTEKRNADVKFEGLLVKFPFNTQKKTYRVWDTTLQKALPVNYKGTQKIHGVTTYKFQGEVPETDAGTVTAPASTFGLPVSGDVTLDRK